MNKGFARIRIDPELRSDVVVHRHVDRPGLLRYGMEEACRFAANPVSS